MRNNIVVIFAILLVACASTTTFGALAVINFENLGAQGDPVASVNLSGITVDLSTENAVGEVFTPFLAEFGAPRVGFLSTPSDETPRNADRSIYTDGGMFSLTDGLRRTHDYIMEFSVPVNNLSLDLYDYRGDGPHLSAVLGVDNVELQVFDMAGAQIGSDTFVLPMTRPVEGNVVSLGVSSGGIHSARLHFNGIEGGTAIDNISFEVVPEPTSLGLTVFGLIGLWGCGRRNRRAA